MCPVITVTCHFDDKDLIYEGIATVLQSAIFAQAVWDDKDLIYEGIATRCARQMS